MTKREQFVLALPQRYLAVNALQERSHGQVSHTVENIQYSNELVRNLHGLGEETNRSLFLVEDNIMYSSR